MALKFLFKYETIKLLKILVCDTKTAMFKLSILLVPNSGKQHDAKTYINKINYIHLRNKIYLIFHTTGNLKANF